jgi:hypothetical protein
MIDLNTITPGSIISFTCNGEPRAAIVLEQYSGQLAVTGEGVPWDIVDHVLNDPTVKNISVLYSAPRKFKVGDIITRDEMLTSLPVGSIFRHDDVNWLAEETSFQEIGAGYSVSKDSNYGAFVATDTELPRTLLWVPQS